MNANEIPGWLDQHGGSAGPPETDANGVTTYRAQDGSYVTVYAGQVRMIGNGSPSQQQQGPAQAPEYVRLRHKVTNELRIIPRATWEQEKANPTLWNGPSIQWAEVDPPQAPAAAAPQPAAQAPAARGGGNMDQAALEAKIAQLQQQYPGLKFMGRSMKDKTVRRVDPDTDQAVSETVRVPVVEWIDPSTGYTLTAEVEPGGGSYTVTNDRLIETNKGDKQSGTKEGDTRGPQNGPKREVFRRGEWVTEDNPLYQAEEGTSQDAVPNRPGWVKITRKKGNDTKTVYRGPDGKEVDSLPEETKTGTKQFTHTDGKTYFEVTETKGGVTSVYVTDSAGNRVTLPGKESKTVTQKRAPNGTVYYEVSVEKDGKKETYTSSDPEGSTRIPPPGTSPMEGVKGVPSFTPDLTKPGAGLIDRQKQLDELMAAGKLTWEQRQAVLEQDIRTAQTVVGEFNSASVMLREDYQQRASQRGQDVQQANARATLANTHYQNAVGVIEKFAPYLGETPGDAGKLFMGMMASQLATATMYGGMKDVPREDMNPQLRGWAEQTVGRSLAPTGAAIPPGPGEAAGPVAAGVAATNAAAANPTGANVQAATDATMQGSAAAFGALGVPPANPDPRAVEAAFRATGQPLPAPLIGATPLTPAIPDAPAQTGQPSSFIDNTVWQQSPQPVGMGLPAPMAGGSPAVGEALFGKSLPEPSSWRQDAEDRMYALTMPQQQAYSAGSGLFGASLPPALTQPSGGIDYGLSMPQGNGGMDAIDAEARRQLAAAGIVV